MNSLVSIRTNIVYIKEVKERFNFVMFIKNNFYICKRE